MAMQALRAGRRLSDVVVQATDADNYTINFGDASNLQVQPRLVVVDDAWTAGFLPAAETSIVSQPTAIGVTSGGAANIPVSATNPALTAAAIQQAFLSTTQNIVIAPAGGDTQPADRPDHHHHVGQSGRDAGADGRRPQRPADLRHHLRRQRRLRRPAGPGNTSRPGHQRGQDALNSTSLTAVIKKESSSEFRVNPENDAAANAFSIQPDQCSGPAVAMDADGDFIITWAAQVSDLANAGSGTDVFARRFEPVGMVDPSDPSWARAFGKST